MYEGLRNNVKSLCGVKENLNVRVVVQRESAISMG